MLLLNGIVALIAIIIAYIGIEIKTYYGLEGLQLSILVFFCLWSYLFITDVIEQYVIEKFNDD